MKSVNDFPKDRPLPGVIVYDNDMNDSSTTTSAIFSANDSIGNTNPYVLIPHDNQLESNDVQYLVRQIQLLLSQ